MFSSCLSVMGLDLHVKVKHTKWRFVLIGLLCQKLHHCGVNQGLKFISFLFESNVLLWYLILANGSSRTSCYLMNYCSESANAGLLWQYESTKQYGFRLPLNTEFHDCCLPRQLIESRLSILCNVTINLLFPGLYLGL